METKMLRMHQIGLAGLALVMSLLAGCASASYAERRAQRIEAFESAAGAPIKSFRFWQLDRWEVVGRDQLVVWTKPKEGYLLKVDEPCSGLEFTQAIGLSSTINRVQVRFDEVVFEGQRCRISQIRPIDHGLLKAARSTASGG